MPEIEITEEQYEYIQALREDLQGDLAGRYATVRTIDAVQFLIDNHEGDLDASVDPDGPAAGRVDVQPPGGDVGSGSGGAGAGSGAAGASSSGAGSGGGAGDAGGGDANDATADGGAAAAGASADDGGSPSGGGPGSGSADDDGMLSAMMQLLETHDGKWWEADGDTGYEVELPDGSTEAANTRDDVRALLFKHYE